MTDPDETTEDVAGQVGDQRAQVAERYDRFAREEARGRSELYAAWAAGVATDASAQAVIARLPAERRQPPLVFALARMNGAVEGDYAGFAAWLRLHGDVLVAEASLRSLQTNEPRRCAALVPALAVFEGPIALIELGASAGLCLVPDRYSYRYSGATRRALDPDDGESTVVIESEVRGDRVPELRMPEVVWRAGLDLRPLDAADADDRRFTTALVWPGEVGRAERIGEALEIAAAAGLRIAAGDATEPAALRALTEAAPPGIPVVVTTPGLLPHVPRAGRARLLGALTELMASGGRDVHWVSLDPPALRHDEWMSGVESAGWPGFVLRRDGAVLAAADPLGAWLEWRAGSGA